jgi:hypothetical protein
VFNKNRERLIEGGIARRFMAAVRNQGSVKALLSDDDFPVDGTLIEAWARRVFAPGAAVASRRRRGATTSGNFTGKGAATRRVRRSRTLTRDCIARDRVSRRSWHIRGMF